MCCAAGEVPVSPAASKVGNTVAASWISSHADLEYVTALAF